MEFIYGYRLIESLNTRRGLTFYRAVKADSVEPAIIERISTVHASPSEIARFKYAFEKIRQLDIEGVVHILDVLEGPDGIAIVREDFAGQALRDCLTFGKIAIASFLNLAVALTRTLGDIHSHDIIHQAITPDAVLWVPATSTLKLTGFGVSGIITHIHEKIHDPAVIKEILPYMAPEQTGRMNCGMDRRTDLYAAGVLFYELLTGAVPFPSNDPMEIIHAHIARMPVAPSEKNSEIPETISGIVMKLLAKTMGERYQSGYGAMADLMECARQWKQNGEIQPFALGRQDMAVSLDAPEKLLGREHETALLSAAFDRTCQGSNEIFLVDGPPGIGKTALINELQKQVIARRACFIAGKAEPDKRDVPYYPIILAFRELARLVLCEPDAQICVWKQRILQALGPNCRMITDLVTQFETIIGPQPEIAPIGPGLVHHRINYVFTEFIKVFATPDHPLILFVDNLQWADTASLQLIRLLSTAPEIHHLLIIGAYQNQEVNDAHPMMQIILDAEKNSATVNRMTLAPLPVEAVHQLVTGMLRTDLSAVEALSDIVHQKTGGNPFLIQQLLKMLYDKKSLVFELHAGWSWDMTQLSETRMAESAVDFMAAHIARLPAPTLEILKRCACYGARFDLAAVAASHHLSIDAAVADISPAVDQGLVDFKGNTGVFSSDSIREGVYQLLPESERTRTHYTFGRYLLDAAPGKPQSNAIISIVNHFNLARTRIVHPNEQKLTASLNHQAGEKALSSGAFEAAFQYFSQGIKWLETACGSSDALWQREYSMALALYSSGAEAAYLVARYEDMNRLTETLIRHSRSFTDSVPARIVLLHALMAQNKLDEVLRSGLSVLADLGVTFPGHPTKGHIILDLIRTKLHIRRLKLEDFLHLPLLTDPIIKAQIEVMAALTSTVYWVSPNLLPLILFRLMRIFASHGNMEYSPYIYAGYGFILCSLGEIEAGYRYGNMALTLLDRMKLPKYRGRTLMVVNTFIRHWKEPAGNEIAPLLEAFQRSMEQGDIEFAGHSMMVRGYSLYFLETPLNEMDMEFQKNSEMLKRLDQVSNLYVVQMFHQMVKNLQSKSQDVCALSGDAYDEAAMLPVHEKVHDQTCLAHFYLNKLMLNWLFGCYQDAYAMTKKLMAHVEGIVSSPVYALCFLYDSLARISYFLLADGLLKKRLLFRVARNQRKMKKWARHSPENFLHRFQLVEAELARLKGKDPDAIILYKKAINGARENGYAQESAIACECLAGFYLDQGINDFAASYMTQARDLYQKWGAHAKVRQLNENHARLLLMTPGAQMLPPSPEVIVPSPSTGPENRLDIIAMMKMSQAISSEITLEKLLVALMRVITENSGAEKALLILNRNGQFAIDAAISGNADKIDILQQIPVEESDALCPGIISYVKRTREPLVLSDARTSGPFAVDPYISKNFVRSLLCLPLIRQQQVIGLIYLENNLTPDAFTPDRVEMIAMLSTQAANCLENAIFFEKTLAAERQAKKQHERYQKLVETMNDGLGIVDPQLQIIFANNALCRMTGYSVEEIRQKTVIDILDDTNQQRLEEEVANWTEKDRHVFEIDWIAKNGGLISTIVSPKPVYDDDGEFAGFLGIVTDVTDLKKAKEEKELAQAQLLQAQKMEAIGMLAGGVAHDFNNYLTTIIGSVDLINIKKNLPENLKKHVAQIKNAAELSAALTRQLLAFGRRQMLEKASVNLNTIVENIQKLLDRLIGENIHLTARLAPDLKLVNADFGQMEQIVMNLAVNARDAMPEGGHIHLKTENVVIDEQYCHHAAYATPGEFVRLTVEDSGAGMDREMMDKIFDPFFSTKGPGHGTGLGLSVVYGVVNQHQGWINVYSEPGHGTTFKIYLPVSQEAAPASIACETSPKKPERLVVQGNQERILLVEDQEEVREVIVTALTESGYIVQETTTIAEARDWMTRAGDEFDLLFTDVILPDGNGIGFAEQAIALNPAIKVLISSGYTEESSRPGTIDRNGFHFLQKPYPLKQLFAILRKLLNNGDNC